MAAAVKSTVKTYFETGDKPIQSEFETFIDSYTDGFTFASSPTVNDDTADGYVVGTHWINTATQDIFICTNTTAGAAVWKGLITGSVAANQVAFGSAANAIQGSADFTYDGTTFTTKTGVFNGTLSVAPVATTGAPNPGILLTAAAHTALTASTEFNAVFINGAVTQEFATGALTTQRFFRVDAPTYSAVGASTITNAATFAVSGAPVAGANATITNRYSIWSQNGTVRMDDIVAAGSGSLAGSVLDLAQTWNTTGSPSAIKLNVTNTARGASSKMLDLQQGGASFFYIDLNGYPVLGYNTNSSQRAYLYVGGNAAANQRLYWDTLRANQLTLAQTSQLNGHDGGITFTLNAGTVIAHNGVGTALILQGSSAWVNPPASPVQLAKHGGNVTVIGGNAVTGATHTGQGGRIYIYGGIANNAGGTPGAFIDGDVHLAVTAANAAIGRVAIGTTTLGAVAKLTINAPVTTDALAGVLITSPVATHKTLVLQGYTAQSANLQEWQTSAGAVVAYISPTGVVFSSTYFRNTPQEVTTAATTTAITSGRVKATGTTAGQTLTMPAGVAGTDVFIRNAATVPVTVARAGADTIEGATTFVLNPNESISLTFVGTDWTVF